MDIKAIDCRLLNVHTPKFRLLFSVNPRLCSQPPGVSNAFDESAQHNSVWRTCREDRVMLGLL